jgi:deoxyribodipyrimidine photo-lyase
MTGGRLNRFNIVKQSKDYDQHGEYVRLWIPELKDVPTELVHEPWKMTQFQQMQYNVQLGLDYPNPIVPPFQPKPYERRDSEARKDSSTTTKGKQRKPNRGSGNKHQKYEMKSLKEGRFELK